MLKIYGGFKFKRISSPLHNLDPRVKFLVAVTLFVGAAIFDRLLPLAVILASMVPIVVVGKSLREWVSMLKGTAIFSAIIFTVHFIYNFSGSGYLVTGWVLESSAAMALDRKSVV